MAADLGQGIAARPARRVVRRYLAQHIVGRRLDPRRNAGRIGGEPGEVRTRGLSGVRHLIVHRRFPGLFGTNITDIHRMTALFEIAPFDGFWQCQAPPTKTLAATDLATAGETQPEVAPAAPDAEGDPA